ncbi:unnamed protein product [Rhizoctonia solani]|uniref:Epoxide hydrolase N-terminal domain-containing protein n=1 Tax=Rhizoctonia solani TaxID=456999 RepID=A0A8H3HGM2_9AGAM|nr:unnamed protein product [Rhizoctonia solani]
MAPYDEIKPFTISVPDDQLDELRKKLELTRLPDELDLPAGQEWEWGIPLAVLKPIVDYWRTKYDWRAVEERINRTLPQFTTYVESAKHGQQEVHFVHKRSENPNAIPLVFVHGWPGSFLEVSKIIEELVNPKDPKHPSFHVISPSLPGYVFSQRASTPGMNATGTAYLFDKLMGKLGYKHYVAQGGDWGARVVRALAVHHQATCLATHSNMTIGSSPTLSRNPIMTMKTTLGHVGLPGGYTQDEMDGIARTKEFMATGTGYSQIQGTRPQTLAVGLTGELMRVNHMRVRAHFLRYIDSPVGLLAWIGEKLYVWTDSYPWTPEELITWAMLYWINGPAGGLRYYKENSITGPPKDLRLQAELDLLRSAWSPTPLGFSSFPKEIVNLPVEWMGIGQRLVYLNRHNKGGHFAAWEVPELLVGDIQSFVTVVLEEEPRLLNVV